MPRPANNIEIFEGGLLAIKAALAHFVVRKNRFMDNVTQKYVNDIAYEIIGCAVEVQRNLGPGLLESIYEKCLLEELKDVGLRAVSQVDVPLHYKGKTLSAPLRLDILVNDLVVVEVKAVDLILPVFKAQLLTYLKLSGRPKGLLLNFNCEQITRDGLVPMVTQEFAALPKS